MREAAIFFDLGETLVDETRAWTVWARLLEVDVFTLFAVLGGVIERGEHHHQVFERLRPGFDADLQHDRFVAAGGALRREDLFPDSIDALRRLRRDGWLIGIAGNFSEDVERSITDLGLSADVVGSSARWGVDKPSPAFFARVAEEAGLPPARILYVGDRVDNDVVPAADAGMTAVFLRRGPWAVLQSSLPDVARAHIVVDSLAELAEMLPAAAPM